jgi:chitinase
MKRSKHKNEELKTRRLSIPRVILAICILIVFIFLGLTFWGENKDIFLNNTDTNSGPWFAPYVDVTATPLYDFEKLGGTNSQNIMLSFIVSSSEDACIPTWGNSYNLDNASISLDLDRRIARLRQLGGDVAVSFGGLLNNELSLGCTDEDKLIQAYKQVIDKYKVVTLDFDLEGKSLSDLQANERRAKVLAKIQNEIRSSGGSLAIWLTLPVVPQGLTNEGTETISTFLGHGVDLAGVNIMTMNYGQSKSEGQSMSEASQKALIETHRQLGILYSQSGINLNKKSLWAKIGATPMIGQNDISTEVFNLEDASALNKYILSQGIVRTSMWSANRDIQCGENYVNTSVVSDSCSGIAQTKNQFGSILSRGIEGSLKLNATSVTKEDKSLDDKTDNPETSPYPIWNELSTYLQGTKVVWHRNVYQSKWWTQGEIPDNPVLQYWETPWELIGPVLAGESPIKLPTLPEGIYPEWSGKTQYEAGDRVLFNGLPFQAKWWTQGDSPAASTSNPTISPWIALTQAQIEAVIKSNQ